MVRIWSRCLPQTAQLRGQAVGAQIAMENSTIWRRVSYEKMQMFYCHVSLPRGMCIPSEGLSLPFRSFWVGCALYLMSWVPCSIVVQHQNTANVFCAVMKLATSSLSTTWSIGISPKHGTHPPPGIPYHEANAAPRHSNAHGHQDPMPQSGRENANMILPTKCQRKDGEIVGVSACSSFNL